jgi:hypothetical protein
VPTRLCSRQAGPVKTVASPAPCNTQLRLSKYLSARAHIIPRTARVPAYYDCCMPGCSAGAGCWPLGTAGHQRIVTYHYPHLDLATHCLSALHRAASILQLCTCTPRSLRAIPRLGWTTESAVTHQPHKMGVHHPGQRPTDHCNLPLRTLHCWEGGNTSLPPTGPRPGCTALVLAAAYPPTCLYMVLLPPSQALQPKLHVAPLPACPLAPARHCSDTCTSCMSV